MKIFGTVRNPSKTEYASSKFKEKIFEISNMFDRDRFDEVIATTKPDLIINCVGFVKQKLLNRQQNFDCIMVNSCLPQYLSNICSKKGIKFLHFSTDCVFSGKKVYTENLIPDAQDIYGVSKQLGETALSESLILRTSIIGHEYQTKNGLLEWFLAQRGEVNGFDNVYFSGLTTVHVANVVEKFVLPNLSISGLYHLSGDKISKFELLKIIREVYSVDTKIRKTSVSFLDRSLDCELFSSEVGYKPESWKNVIEKMKEFNHENF